MLNTKIDKKREPHVKMQEKMQENHQTLEERDGTDSFSQPSERTNHVDTLMSGFWPPELYDSKFLLLKSPTNSSDRPAWPYRGELLPIQLAQEMILRLS